jgi:hypothetical protein
VLSEFATRLSSRVDINENQPNNKKIPLWQSDSILNFYHSMTISPPRTIPMFFFSKHLPLHLINLSPFVINVKDIFPSRATPPDLNLPETDLPT